VLLAPEHASTQQPSTKILRVGIMTQAATDKDPRFDAFRERLHDLGYVEGRNIILEFRFAGGDFSSVPQLAAELLAPPVDVIVPEGVGASALDAKGRTPIGVREGGACSGRSGSETATRGEWHGVR